MVRRAFLPVLAGALLVFGCAGPRPALERSLPGAFPNHSAQQIRDQLLAPLDTLHAFRARSSLVIRAPENSGSFSAEMHDRRGDSLYVSISPGLGIEAARALVTPDSFFFYDRLKNHVLYGPLSEASGLLPEPFASEDLFDNLLGLPAPEAGIDWLVEADDEHYYLRDSGGRSLYVIDAALWRVIRFEQRDASGKLTERRIFSEFAEFDGVVLPRRLVFERPQDDRMASVYYRSLRLNPVNLRFALDVRDSAERRPVGE
jgi:hypothetical protein